MKRILLITALSFTLFNCGNSKETIEDIETAVEETAEEIEGTEEIVDAVEERIENAETRIEEVEETVEEASETVEYEMINYRLIGIVHVSETDCPLYIEAKDKDKTLRLYPMNLPDKFKRDGMRIKFAHEISKGAAPSTCKVDHVVSVSDVTLMR